MGTPEGAGRAPVAGVYALAAGVACVAAALTAVVPAVGADAVAVRIPAAFVLVAAGFAVGEALTVDLQVRREALTLSISSVPLIVGLYVLGPVALVGARLLGSLLSIAVKRRSPPLKLAVNGAAFWLETAIAAWIFHALSPGGTGVLTWAGAVGGVLVGDVVAVAFLMAAISLFQRRWDVSAFATQHISTANTVVDACVALIAVTLLAHEPAAVALLGVVLAMVVVSYRVHASLRQRHRDLAELYRVTTDLADAVLEGRVSATVLTSARDLLHGEDAWLYVPLGDDRLGRVVLRGDGETVTELVAPVGGHARLHAAAQAQREAFVVVPRTHLSDGVGGTDLLVAALRGEPDAAATLVVATRTATSRRFGDEDLPLFATVANQVGVTIANDRLVARLREHAAESEHQSLHDALTGLPNRTLFERDLARHLEHGRPVAVLLLDLDRFKDVNDTLGHHNGDQLLLQVADRLRHTLRAGDTVCRLGGDEFAVLLPDVEEAQAAMQAARAILAALVRPIEVADVAVDVGASIGVALAPSHGQEVGGLLQRADVAMYTAKADQSGVEVYETARDGYSRERLSLVGELRAAIESGELDVHFQPLVELERLRPVGAEALVRWFHPVRGFVSPDELVSVAERSGLIRPLTDLVLDRALLACADWRARGWDLRVSVNLSARSLLQPTLVADVAAALARSGVPASSLCLELTETSVLGDPRRTVAALEALADLGITIAIDDFGTGHSSLAYLKTLPVREIKIDRSFVLSMASDRSDQAIVQSIVDLAANLRLPVVAEGIEDVVLAGVLRAMGCDLGQGYGFAKPMAAADLLRWIAEQLGDRVLVSA